MNWELSDCRNLSELADQVTALEKTSVIHFSFLMTVILTLVFMFIYHQRSVDKSLLQFMIVSSFIFYVLNVIRLAFFPIPINETYIEYGSYYRYETEKIVDNWYFYQVHSR